MEETVSRLVQGLHVVLTSVDRTFPSHDADGEVDGRDTNLKQGAFDVLPKIEQESSACFILR